jgi:hypothetical protein
MPVVSTDLRLDRSERVLVVENTQDVEPILETNKQLQSEAQKSDWGRMVARVPEVVIVDWLNKEYERGNVELRYLGPGFDEWFARKIKDPDNRAWRTDNPSNPFHIGYRK